MNFINPTYLFGLLGFIIPIAIHLWNKKEAKVIKVGSIQYVPNQDSNQSKSIQLNEILLLLLRCLLLGIISFLMAGLISNEDSAKQNIVLVEPELLGESRVQSALDTLVDQYDIRLMTANTPIYNPENEVSGTSLTLWELTNDLNKLNADSVLVLSNQTLAGTQGKRPEINKIVNIISIDPLESTNYLAAAFKITDSYLLFYGNSDGINTTYTKQSVSTLPETVETNDNQVRIKDQQYWVDIKQLDTLKVAIVYDDEFVKDKTILVATINAISEFTGFPIELITEKDTLTINDPDWLIWLSDKELPTSGLKSISIKEDGFESIVYKAPKEQQYYLNARLNYHNVLANDLSNRLMELFYELPVDKNDQSMIAASQLMPIKNAEIVTLNAQNKADHQYWLWMVLALVFVFERFVSMKKAL